MPHRPSLILLALSAPAALLGFCLGSGWLAAVAVAVFPAALMGIGAARGGRLGWLRWPFLLLGAIFVGGFVTLLTLPQGGPDVGGLPLGTVLMLVGIVAVPFVITSWAYVAGFGRAGVRDEHLERLRSLAAREE
ncbi:MAG TPA: hypothetical protein VEI97_13345 [bacterium]|nr:hypothetical protein [bacterium]